MSESDFLVPAIAGCFGAAVGSFLNVVIYRLPRESLSIMKPVRSFCPACKHTLTWYENIPVFSYLILGGKCSSCKEPISARYPLVEGLTIILFMALTFREMDRFLSGRPDGFQWLCITIVHLFMIMAAVAVTFIDIDFRIIPNEINYLGIAAAPILSAILPLLHEDDSLFVSLSESLPSWSASLIASLAGLAAGALVLLFVGRMGKWMFKKEAMGMGDVKYVAFMGGFLGWGGCLIVFLLACLSGAVIGIVYKIISNRHDIPFGPFLSFGMIMILFFRQDVFDFLFVTWPEWVHSFLG